jgi:hypothetical protein
MFKNINHLFNVLHTKNYLLVLKIKEFFKLIYFLSPIFLLKLNLGYSDYLITLLF